MPASLGSMHEATTMDMQGSSVRLGQFVLQITAGKRGTRR